MTGRKLAKCFATAVAITLLAGCSDDASQPTAVADRPTASGGGHSMHQMSGSLVTTTTDPFTYRAALDAFKIHQLPDFMIHSKTTSDIVMQRSIFNPGTGPWHTHPGPSFVYVIDGQIKLDRYTDTGECVSTQVHNPGAAYFETANEVHRAVVVSAQPAVLLVTRFNIPIGSPITIPAADPGC